MRNGLPPVSVCNNFIVVMRLAANFILLLVGNIRCFEFDSHKEFILHVNEFFGNDTENYILLRIPQMCVLLRFKHDGSQYHMNLRAVEFGQRLCFFFYKCIFFKLCLQLSLSLAVEASAMTVCNLLYVMHMIRILGTSKTALICPIPRLIFVELSLSSKKLWTFTSRTKMIYWYYLYFRIHV